MQCCPIANFGPLSKECIQQFDVNHCLLCDFRPKEDQEAPNAIESLSTIEHPGRVIYLQLFFHAVSNGIQVTIIRQPAYTRFLLTTRSACPFHIKPVISFAQLLFSSLFFFFDTLYHHVLIPLASLWPMVLFKDFQEKRPSKPYLER